MNAIVTGASRGLGRALARALAGRGYGLVIDARGSAALDEVAAELMTRTKVVSVSGDLADESHLQDLAEAAATLGGAQILVNSASLLGPSPQPHLDAYPIDVLERVFRVNVVAPLRLYQLTAGSLDRIINVTSDAASGAYKGWGGYGASKAALEQLSNVLAAERPDLRVYWVDPGDMNTQMQQEAFPGEDISDRPPPEESVPGLLALIEGELPSGRYEARSPAFIETGP